VTISAIGIVTVQLYTRIFASFAFYMLSVHIYSFLFEVCVMLLVGVVNNFLFVTNHYLCVSSHKVQVIKQVYFNDFEKQFNLIGRAGQ
jgi:hypothetical protein